MLGIPFEVTPVVTASGWVVVDFLVVVEEAMPSAEVEAAGGGKTRYSLFKCCVL